MSNPLETAVSASACRPPSRARGARVAKFQREQRIVDCLNCGLSVARIAAEIGVGEKRMRALVREILARRMPHPPAEFVAIQMSCLNEALLVAFSAMSPSNLKAVDQVVKIVRELDRYGGAFAAEWARPAASRLDAPADEDVAFAKAWLGGGELEDDRGGDRPENLAQSSEMIDSAPGNPRLWDGYVADAGRAPLLRRRPGKCLPPGEDPGVSPKATDGVWPAASTRIALHKPRRDPTATETCFPHPIRRVPPDTFPSKAGKGGRRQATLARKSWRKLMKRLNPRPGLGCAPRPPRPSRPARSPPTSCGAC